MGKYYVPVYIIVNDTHIFDATVFAEVVPMTLRCYHSIVNITKENRTPTVEISNPVNCEVKFKWEVQDTNFLIIPQSGYIMPQKTIRCQLKTIPLPGAVLKTEIYLLSQSGSKQIIKVICQNEPADLIYHMTSILFENIALNVSVTKYVVIRNTSNQNILLEVINPKPINEITVTPNSLLLNGQSNCVFKITVHFKAVTTFKCKIIFRQQEAYETELFISGNVAYPSIILQPSSIQFTKVPAWTCQMKSFQLTNTGITLNSVEFDASQYPGITFTDMDRNVITEKIMLQPKETINLYVQFQPTEPAIYSFFIPYILNGIIGPPLLNNPKSLYSSMHYIIQSDQNSNVVNETLPVVRVRCASRVPIVKFSAININCNYIEDETPKTFSTKNVCNYECVVILSTVSIGEDFILSIDNFKGIYKATDTFYKVTLQPQEEVTFLIEFIPKEFGEYETFIPIFVDTFCISEPFNVLHVTGLYPKPEINSCVKMLYFQTMPIKKKVSSCLHLEFLNHQEDCVFNPKSINDSFVVEIKAKKILSPHSMNYELKIVFSPKKESNHSFKMEFFCSCDSTIQIMIVASADNSNILLYKYPCVAEITSICGKPFPYLIRDSSFSTVNIDNIIKALESWIYTQCFFGNDLYSIPYTISRYSFNVYYSDTKTKLPGDRKKKRVIHLPIVHILVNLIDRSILKYLTDG